MLASSKSKKLSRTCWLMPGPTE